MLRFTLLPLLACCTSSDASIDIKIGQMLMVGFRGTELADDATILKDIRHRHLGGVVLFEHDVPTGGRTRNIKSPKQVGRLVARLHAAAHLPLLVAIDQEGGRVRRLRSEFGLGARSSAAYFGEVDDPAVTARHAQRTARVLAGLGINLNFAPVVDLNVNPESPAIGHHGRSYGSYTEKVLRHARKVIEAHHQEGLLTTIKHFPGHGSASGDTHHGLVDVSTTWSQRELEPFERLIRDGSCDAVMTAHLYNSQIDPALPATLSHETIDGLLRQKLGFDGVVIADDLQMGAIRSRHGTKEVVKLAIRAGVDILVFANNSVYDEQITERVIDMIKRMVRTGELSEAQIDRAFERVQKLKKRLPKE